MSLIEVHGRLATSALLYTIVMGVWGLWRYFRHENVNSSYWGALIIGEILYLAQGSLGAFLFFSGIGNLSGKLIHILYGVVCVLTLPAIFFFTRGEESRRPMLIYGVGFLFLIGIILRGISTAG